MLKRLYLFLFGIVLSAYAFSISSPVHVSPGNASTNHPVAVSLDWNGVSGNTGYLYQLDTVATFDSPLLLSGTTGASVSEAYVSSLYFGQTYYWRCATKSAVDTSAWTSAWSFTTTNVISNSAPSSGSIGHNVGLTLDWNGISGNTGYLYQLDTVASFNSPLLVDGTTGASVSEVYVSSLYFGQTYYWRCAAKNAVDTSAWTSTWSFTTTNVISNSAPSSGSIGHNVGLTLDWNGISGNTGYLYQLDTVASFNSPLLVDGTTGANASEIYVSNLYFGQKYYWRCAAKNAVDTSAWTSAWSFTTTNVIFNSAPSNGSIGTNVGLTLDWSGLPGNTGYLYQLDTVADFNSPLLVSGATGSNSSEIYVSNLYFGQKYYWRCAAKNAVDTSAWTSAWSFTTADYISNVAPSNGSIGTNVGLTLDWSNITGNIGYLYQLDTVADFNSPLLVSGATGSNSSEIYVSNLYFGQKYYWRCAAKNAVDTSAWTSAWSFTTGDFVYNSSPSNAAVGVSVNPNLDWSNFTGASAYLCRVDTTLNFNSGELRIFSVVSSQTSASGLLYGAVYYWQAAARNAVDTSSWNTAWSFTTAYEITTAPSLISPTNLSIDVAYNTLGLQWSSIAAANTYQYQVSTVSNFATLAKYGTTSLVTTSISGLNPHTTYYWRVRAANANGYSPWSAAWIFTTESANLTSPVLVAPFNNAIGINAESVLLDWNSVFGASSYIFEITEDENFISGITTQSVSETFKTLMGLSLGTQYFWRVKASDGVVESDWSDVWNFTTQSLSLAAPVLISPANNQVNVPINNLNLHWNLVANASQYIYEIGTDEAFTQNVVSETIALNSVAFADADYNTQYFWRVKASDGSMESNWSEVWSFTTEVQITYYTLTIQIDGSGLVLVDDVEYTSPLMIEGGTSVSLLVGLLSDWQFAQWTGDLTGNGNPAIVMMDGDKYITAEFIFVGVDQTGNDVQERRIYPNPANDKIIILGEGIGCVEIFSLDGRLVMVENEYIQGKPIHVSSLQPGVYFIKLNHQKSGFIKMLKE